MILLYKSGQQDLNLRPHGSRFNPQTLDFKGFPDLR
nr:MAG TPA: hypothetical protein [Caudoviricetes sp.]